MAKADFKMIDSDPGFVKVKKNIQGPDKSAIGYFEDQGSNARGDSLVKQAFDNEIGTEKIPPRPYLRRPFDQKKKKLIGQMRAQVIPLMIGKTTKKKVLTDISKDFIKTAQKGMVSGPWIENAPATVAKKGFDQPLIHTGEMKEKMTFRLRKK